MTDNRFGSWSLRSVSCKIDAHFLLMFTLCSVFEWFVTLAVFNVLLCRVLVPLFLLLFFVRLTESASPNIVDFLNRSDLAGLFGAWGLRSPLTVRRRFGPNVWDALQNVVIKISKISQREDFFVCSMDRQRVSKLVVKLGKDLQSSVDWAWHRRTWLNRSEVSSFESTFIRATKREDFVRSSAQCKHIHFVLYSY